MASTATDTEIPSITWEKSEAPRGGVNPRRKIIRGPIQKSRKLVISRIVGLSVNLVPILMILVGAVCFRDCPREPLVPVWLIVAGCLYLATTLMDLIICFKKDYDRPLAVRIWDHTIVAIMMAWLVLGSIWVYEMDEEAGYCHPMVFYLSHVLITLTYVFILIVTTLLLLIGGIVAIFG